MYDAICEIDGKKYGSFIVCPIGRGRSDQLEKLRSDLIAAAVDTLLDRGILKIEETPAADGCTIMQVKLWALKEIN